VSAEGFGSTRPVMVDGVEDKAASRRVEFRVVVA
jgi:outer membrane protein OmpA-like peptidoglycan-associated protein